MRRGQFEPFCFASYQILNEFTERKLETSSMQNLSRLLGMKIKAQIKPGSKKPEGLEILDDGTYLIHLKARPVEGAANTALIKFLAAEFGVKKSQVIIKTGHKSRFKYIEIEGLDNLNHEWT